jgi:hypothetical protein
MVNVITPQFNLHSEEANVSFFRKYDFFCYHFMSFSYELVCYFFRGKDCRGNPYNTLLFNLKKV